MGSLLTRAWAADFFVSCINVRLPVAILIMALGYTFSFLLWACAWFALYRCARGRSARSPCSWQARTHVQAGTDKHAWGLLSRVLLLWQPRLHSTASAQVGLQTQAALVCRYDSTCLSGFESNYGGFVSAFLFATETQQTIGELHSMLHCCHVSCCRLVASTALPRPAACLP